MDPSKLLGWIKLSPKHLVAILLASAFLTFGRDAWLHSLGLLEFRDAYRASIGVPLLASAALLGAHAVTSTWQLVSKRLSRRRNLKRLHRKLHRLSPAERAILREYIEGQTKTRYLKIDDGIVQGLVADKILYQSANVGRLTIFAFNIQPWAWEYLNTNPHLLVDLPGDLPPSVNQWPARP